MSTKGLMAHKKVAEVTLNEAGKAATLTLAPGWLYEGSSGPFTLTNVEHGHSIVKGAIGDGTGTKVSRPPKISRGLAEALTNDGIPPEPSADRKPVSKSSEFKAPRDAADEFVYRMVLCPIGTEPLGQGREVCGWLKSTTALDKRALAKRTWEMLGNYVKGSDSEPVTDATHEPKSFRWTNAHQADARKRQEMGAPFKDTNFGDR